jgi:hypothetical protein
MKGFLYYTDNQCEERIIQVVRDQLEKCRKGRPLVSVSQYPISFGENIVLPLERSYLSMFRQVMAGLERLKTEIVFFVEHDVLYHPTHFDFTPSKEDVYYYNMNIWDLDSDTGRTLHHERMKKTSGLVAYRKILLEHFRKKIEKVEKEGWSKNKIGFEPGNKPSKGRIDYERELFKSEWPNINIRHGNNITPPRWKLSQYRCRRAIKDSWVESDGIPSWGKTKGRVGDFFRSLYAQ